ncbi:MAG: substrate-binding domain-containing protein [bacterium]|nr:substrate-binding domain-containing protein [bacterium]
MSHQRGTFLIGLTLVVSAIFPTACSGEPGGEKVRIAVVPKGTAHDFWQSVHAGAKSAAVDLGVEIQWKGPQPEGDREAQIRLIETLANGSAKGLLLAPVDARALAAPVEQARRGGVPTVVFDSGLDGEAHVGFVATDNRKGGERAGEELGRLLNGRGKVVMLRYQEGSASTMAREEGFLAAIAVKYPDIEIVSSNQYAPSLEAARSKADALLLAHPDLDGVFCPNESTVHGFLSALDAAGKAGKVKFVGFDANPELLAGLERRHIDALVLQDPVGMGRRGLELLVKHLRGEEIPPVEHTAMHVATPDNREDPMIAALLEPDLSILDK